LEDYDYRKFAEFFEKTPGNSGQYTGLLQPTLFASGNRMNGPLTNILKYTFRYKNKLGKLDLEKSLWYTKLQIMDHDNFLPPVPIRKRITISTYFRENVQFNRMQEDAAHLTYLYNITGNILMLHDLVQVLTDYIEDYDDNEC